MTREQALERAWDHYREHEKRKSYILKYHWLVRNWSSEWDKEFHKMVQWARIINKLEGR